MYPTSVLSSSRFSTRTMIRLLRATMAWRRHMNWWRVTTIGRGNASSLMIMLLLVRFANEARPHAKSHLGFCNLWKRRTGHGARLLWTLLSNFLFHKDLTVFWLSWIAIRSLDISY